MYQAPPPSDEPLRNKADRYALAVGWLAGLLYGLIHVFKIFPDHWVGEVAVRIGGAVLWYLPYRKLDALYFAGWIQRVRMLLGLYAGLALMTLIPSFAEPPELWLPGAMLILGASTIAGALLSLILAHRWIRPKI